MTFPLACAVAIVVGLSIGICLRNFRAPAGRPFGPASGGLYSP